MNIQASPTFFRIYYQQIVILKILIDNKNFFQA